MTGLHKSDRRFATPPASDPLATSGDILRKEERTLEDALAIADVMNPTLDAERKNIDLGTAAIWEASLYPNPAFVLEVRDYPTGGGGIGASDRTAGVRLPVVVGGRIGAASSLAEKEREIAAMNYVWKRRQILGDVKRAFVSVLAARRTVELMRESRDLAGRLHDAANDRFKVAAIPEMEVLKSAVQRAKAESDLRLAEKDADVGLKSLHAHMGNIDIRMDKLGGNLHTRFALPAFEAIQGQVTKSHPLLAAAGGAEEAARLQLGLAEAERIPDIGLEVTGGRSSEDESIVEAGLEIPLPIFNRNQAKIAAAEIRERQAILHTQSVRNELMLRLTEGYRTLVAAQDRVAVYNDEILLKAGKALDQTNEGYRLGKFTHLDVLDSQRTLAEARIAFGAALKDLNEAAAALEVITGTAVEPVR